MSELVSPSRFELVSVWASVSEFLLAFPSVFQLAFQLGFELLSVLACG